MMSLWLNKSNSFNQCVIVLILLFCVCSHQRDGTTTKMLNLYSKHLDLTEKWRAVFPVSISQSMAKKQKMLDLKSNKYSSRFFLSVDYVFSKTVPVLWMSLFMPVFREYFPFCSAQYISVIFFSVHWWIQKFHSSSGNCLNAMYRLGSKNNYIKKHCLTAFCENVAKGALTSFNNQKKSPLGPNL